MSRKIVVKGCKTCPYCLCTDDFDCYSGYKCSKRTIGWSDDEFIKLPDNYIAWACPLEFDNEGGEQ